MINMTEFDITTQQQIRASFWEAHPSLKRIPGWKQNQYRANTRMAFCDYVEHLRRDNKISETLASRATL